jgi:hypothetical protein
MHAATDPRALIEVFRRALRGIVDGMQQVISRPFSRVDPSTLPPAIPVE